MKWKAQRIIGARWENKEWFFLINLVVCFVFSILVVVLSQVMIGVKVLSVDLLKLFAGVMIVFVIILSVYCLLGEIKSSLVLGTLMFMIISTVNVYVYNFRGRLFEPADIFSARTALNVADNYSLFPIPYRIVFGWFIWIGAIVLIWGGQWYYRERLTVSRRLALVTCCMIGVFFLGKYVVDLETYHWDKDGARINGYILDFFSKIKESYIAKPHGYSAEKIDKLLNQYEDCSVNAQRQVKTPHIIVIMNEAFSDLNVLGEVKTNIDVMPFVENLEENTVSGYALASVLGGNTASSEWEFLTGNTMAWLSPNAVPYQQYIKSPTYSMASYLKTKYDYKCVAIHPYLASGWNRPSAYKYMGFDKSFFVEDFPQEDYVRCYISDQEMFGKIIDIYENRSENPLFLFGVSMQNHGGYLYAGGNYDHDVYLSEKKEYNFEVEQYLSLIHETDRAVERLISYFENVDEDVVVVFFGDHQPKLDENFYADIENEDGVLLEKQQKKYMVPFFIWSNYDIEEKEITCTSLNYLSSYVYEAAGLDFPQYNLFLMDMEKKISAINVNGFYSLMSNRYLLFEEASQEEKAVLESYRQLQFNNAFDARQRNKAFPVVER